MRVRIPFNPHFIIMGLQLIHTLVQRQFKRRVGQANHFLITIIVGLDEVGKGGVSKSDMLDVAWNPKDVRVSSNRSKEFARNSSLAWIIDNFDSYVNACKRKPSVIVNAGLLSKIDQANRSVNEKFMALFDRYKHINEIKLYGALLALGIQWRNVTTHIDANNILGKEHETVLLDNKEWFYKNSCHLDIVETLNHFVAHKSPTLKEITSIIKAVLRFVELVDSELVKEINTDIYTAEIIYNHFGGVNEEKHSTQIGLFKTLTLERKISRIKNILLNNGFTDVGEGNGLVVDEVFVEKIIDSYE